jgi:hypothetical protein
LPTVAGCEPVICGRAAINGEFLRSVKAVTATIAASVPMMAKFAGDCLGTPLF